MDEEDFSAIGNRLDTTHTALDEDNIFIPRGKGNAAKIVVPHYDDIQLDSDGLAILPFDFLPSVVEQLPDDWFYVTYPWYKFFDRQQRDSDDCVTAPIELATANPDNVKKWKTLVQRMFVEKFKEEGRYHYGVEIGRMALKDKYIYEGENEKGRRADTTELAMKVLFNTVSPDLLAKGHIGKLISFVWKWLYVPNLEGNNQWVKDSLAEFFKIHDARVVLSHHTKSGKRVHSVVKMFKKYGTQSAIRTFKNHQLRNWGFTIEVNKYKHKDGTMPPCAEGERWSVHNIEAYLDKKTRNMMRRNGGFDFCVRHSRGEVNHGRMFSSDLQDTVQKALNYGCDKQEVLTNLREMIEQVEGGIIEPFAESTQKIIIDTNDIIEPMATGRKTRKGDSDSVDSRYGGDIDNLKYAAIDTNILLDSLGNLNDDSGNDWAEVTASPRGWRSPRRRREASPVRQVEEVLPPTNTIGRSPTRRREASPVRQVKEVLPVRQGGDKLPVKNREYGYTSRGTPPHRARNTMNSREDDKSAKKKNEIQEKMKAISAKNTKVCVVIFTMYQIRALANDIIHYNQKSGRRLVEGKRGRERGLNTAQGGGNPWWEHIKDELEESSLFGIARMPLRGVAIVSMEFAAFAK